MKKRQSILVCLLLLLSFALCGCQPTETPQTEQTRETKEIQETIALAEDADAFRIEILKIGKADAIILQTKAHCVLIDCGETEDGAEVCEYLEKEGINKIDYLFITHFDKDHVGGFPTVVESVPADKVVVPDYEGSNSEYEDYENTVAERQIAPVKLRETMTFTLDGTEFTVYPPQKDAYAESDNDFSLAVSVAHGENSFLFAGDAMADRLAEIMEQTGRSAYDFLKVPHHGRWNQNTQKFVETVKAPYAVITCSKKNPAEEKTVAALEKAGSQVYMTKDGDVSIVSDGKTIAVSQ